MQKVLIIFLLVGSVPLASAFQVQGSRNHLLCYQHCSIAKIPNLSSSSRYYEHFRKSIYFMTPHSNQQDSYETHESTELLSELVEDQAKGLELATTENDFNDHNNGNESISKQIFALALPAFIALSIDPIMAIVDTAFIGKTAVNADALAGVGTAQGLLTFTFYLFSFLTSVTTPMVSQKRASGKLNDAIRIGGQALALAITLGASLTFLLITFSTPLLSIMGVGNLTTDATIVATSFLQIRSLAPIAIFIISASTGILRGFLDTQTALVIVFGANIINLALDIILITFGHLGATGAAIATTIAEYCAAMSFLGVLGGVLPSAEGKMLGSNQRNKEKRNNSTDVLTLLEEPLLPPPTVQGHQSNESLVKITPILQIPDWGETKPLIVASSSVFLRSFVLQVVLAGATAMATRSGNNDSAIAAANIAAHQIALQLWLLCSFICDALAAASQALVADSIGRNDADGTRTICKAIVTYSLVLGFILSVSLFIMGQNGVLLSLFTNDKSTQESLKDIMFILTLSQPLNAYVFAADGIIQGASEFVYEAKSMVLSAAVAVACFFVLQSSNVNSLENVWYALVTLMAMRGLTATYKISSFF